MSTSNTNWPANRYRRRMGLRLRRKQYQSASAGTPTGLMDPPSNGGGANPGVDAAALEAQTAELNATVEKYKDQLLRLQAEFENFRKRSRQQLEELKATASAATLESLLPVLDNFGRALQSPAASPESFLEGVKMIHSQFGGLLQQAGLEPIDAKGQVFDPNFHEAVAVDTSGQHPENTVVEVLQNGYMLKGKLIRPAIVRVARSE